VKQGGLNSEFDGRANRRRVDSGISRDPCPQDPPPGTDGCSPAQDSIRRIRDQRADDRHVETVRTDGGDAPVSKENCLNGQCH